MHPLKRSPLHSSVFALVLTAFALLVSVLLRPYMGSDSAAVLLLAVLVSAWYHGRTGGLIATAGATTAVVYYSFGSGLSREPAVGAVLRVISFAALALLVTWLTASWRESRRILNSVISSIGDAVLATDVQGRITFLNPVAETLTGWPVADARGKPVAEVMQLADGKSRESIENPLTCALRERVTVTPHGHSLLA